MDTVSTRLRPRYEGANMGTLIGFKHMLYLVEEAVLDWFRHQGYGPHRLYHEHGLALQLVDVSARLIHVLGIDDEVIADTRTSSPGRFAVTLSTSRDGVPVTVLRAHVTAELFGKPTVSTMPLPDDLAAIVTDDETTGVVAERDNHSVPPGHTARDVVAHPDSTTFWWAWIARYLYCHYFDRVQHSGYIRALEATVDRFLADRGLAIETVLNERGWVPVVSKTRIQILAAAHMGETVHTTFSVEGFTAGRTYDARMNCHVERDGELVHVATATITHGYIQAGELAVQALELGDDVVAALEGK